MIINNCFQHVLIYFVERFFLYSFQGKATRYCSKTFAWSRPNLTGCRNKQLLSIEKQVSFMFQLFFFLYFCSMSLLLLFFILVNKLQYQVWIVFSLFKLLIIIIIPQNGFYILYENKKRKWRIRISAMA